MNINDLSPADIGKGTIRTHFGVERLSERYEGIEYLVEAMAEIVFELVAHDGKVGDRLLIEIGRASCRERV